MAKLSTHPFRRGFTLDRASILRLPKVAAQESVAFAARMNRLLDEIVRDAAAKIERGETIASISASMGAAWELAFNAINQPWAEAYAVDGFKLAGAAMSRKSFIGGARGKALDATLDGADALIAVFMRARISEWVQKTSRLETQTTAAQFEAIIRRAVAGTLDVATGVTRGLTPIEMAKEFLNAGLALDKTRARLMAETLTNWAYNEGAQEQYRRSGIERKEWLVTEDDLTCPLCEPMHGKTVAVDAVFFHEGDTHTGNDDRSVTMDFDIEHPPLHPRCVLGETPVLAASLVTAMRANYCGDVIELGLADGRSLTVTPNHMLLTPDGFASAESLREGDDVIDCAAVQGVVRGDPNNDVRPALIRDVFEAASVAPGVAAARVPVAAEYLHGDARFANGHVDVVSPNGFLSDTGEASRAEHVHQHDLCRTNPGLPGLTGRSDLAAMLLGLGLAADGIVGVRRESATFARRRSLHSDEVGFAAAPDRHAALVEDSPNRGPANPEAKRDRKLGISRGVSGNDSALGEIDPIAAYWNAATLEHPEESGDSDSERIADCARGFPGLISTARITFKSVRKFCGHVYDLHSLESVYIANGILSSNCRCVLLPVVEDE